MKISNQRWVKWITVTVCFVILPLLLLLIAFILPAHADAKHYTELSFPPLRAVTLPKYTTFQLKNGATIYLMEDHELPLVSGTALFATGDRLEPADQIGLAEVTGYGMRSGGTKRHPPEVLNQLLEQRAASIETFVGTTAGRGSFSSLSEDLESVLGLFVEVLREPAFAPDQVELIKSQLNGAIARRNDDPDMISVREFRKLVYGADSPYARTIEYSTLDNVDRDDLIKFHQQYFQPQTLLFGLVGDFDSKALRSLLEAKLADWPTGNLKAPPLSTVKQSQAGGLFLVEQPQLTQSYIQLGHLGGQYNSQDYPALEVMNQVLNGFGGRLFNQVRSRQGLAYSVYASWSPQFDYPGLFIAGGQTRSASTVPFLQALQTELNQLRTAPITAAELTQAKDSVLNSFVFNFQDPGQTLSRLLWYRYYDYPADFIFQYQKAVKATQIPDIQRVAQQYLQPRQLVTLVVGNPGQIKPTLDTLTARSTVKTIDITIPAPQVPTKKAA
jgi:zinc protease